MSACEKYCFIFCSGSDTDDIVRVILRQLIQNCVLTQCLCDKVDALSLRDMGREGLIDIRRDQARIVGDAGSDDLDLNSHLKSLLHRFSPFLSVSNKSVMNPPLLEKCNTKRLD